MDVAFQKPVGGTPPRRHRRQALGEPIRQGLVEIVVVDEASLLEMQQVLIARDFQVVHLVGHGSYDQEHGGHLVVEDEQGNSTPLAGERFCDGHWEAVLESGRITALLQRLRHYE